MKSAIGKAQIKEAVRARDRCIRDAAHVVHPHARADANHKQHERAVANARLWNKRDPKEDLERQLRELQAAVANISNYLKYVSSQQVPNVSFLDEVLLALESKQSSLADVTLSQEFIDALSSDDL